MWLPQKLVFFFIFYFMENRKIRNKNGWFGVITPFQETSISLCFRCQSHPIFGGLFSAKQSRSLRNACFAFAMLAGIDALLKEAIVMSRVSGGRVIDVLLVKEIIRWSKKKRALQCCFLILAATVLASYLFVQYNLVHIIVFVDQILVTIMLSESANYAHRGQNMLTPVKTQTTVRQGCSNSFGWSMIDTFGGSMAHFISIFDPIFAPHSRPRMERYKSSLLLCRWEEVPVRAFTPRKVLRVIRTA